MCNDAPPAPPAPDPAATAAAQAKMNRETAITQFGLNAVNQITPDGSLTYKQIGTWPDGTPRYEATTALSKPQQAIYDTNQQTQQNFANIGRDQSARIGDLLGTPLQLGNEATEARLMDLGMKRLTPQFERNQEALRTRLLNSGIREGSDAWNAEMSRMSQSENDAITQLLLSGRAQANQEIMAERNAPINEITALMSGSQVSNPNFVSTPQTQVAGVDYAGMVQNNYNNQMQAWQQQNQNSNAMMGGLFGLGGTLGSAAMKYGPSLMMMSDRRAKEDIEQVGDLRNGLPVYVFRYKGDGTPQIGLMADDVEQLHPEAVAMGSDGYKRVDYARAVH
jgi:hypothetical protein